MLDIYHPKDALIWTKRDRHKYMEWGWKKIDMNLHLVLFSFIVDIWPGSAYPSHEWNKHFSFSKKASLKAAILGIRMRSTELLLWKNQKYWTLYSIILYKRDSTADIFWWIFNFFWTNNSQKSSKARILKGFYWRKMSDYYCFCRSAQGQLSQCNRRNTATVLRAVVKSHSGLKGTKVFACECSGRNFKLKNFSKFAGKSSCWGPFILQLQLVIAFVRLLGQLYQKNDAYTETLTQVLPVNFEKNDEHDY